jgi:hypothetical protein
MHSFAAVEIRSLADGALPVRLLHAAYRASRRGRIILILDGIPPSAVDDALDPLVPSIRLDIPGLVYVDGRDGTAVAEAVEAAGIVFASGSDGITENKARPCRMRSLAEAEAMLDRMARPTRIAELSQNSRRPL